MCHFPGTRSAQDSPGYFRQFRNPGQNMSPGSGTSGHLIIWVSENGDNGELFLQIGVSRSKHDTYVNKCEQTQVIDHSVNRCRSDSLLDLGWVLLNGCLDFGKKNASSVHYDQTATQTCMMRNKWFQDGAAMFGCRPGRSAKTMLLFTFLLTFDFYFYTHNIGTDHL